MKKTRIAGVSGLTAALWLGTLIGPGPDGPAALRGAEPDRSRLAGPGATVMEVAPRQEAADTLEADTIEADTLVHYREGREALNRGDYERAARLFAELVELAPQSARAADALYWRAFSLYRLGGEEGLAAALQALERQREAYPSALRAQDAAALRARIEGQLARLGDVQAAVRVAERAAMAAGASADARARMSEARAAEAVARAESIAQGGGVAEGAAWGRADGGGRAQEACPDEEDDVQTAALNALMHMDSDRALPLLEQVLARRDPCSVPLRRRALFLVSQQEGPRTEDLLLDVARSDPDPEVREQAVFWLSQVEGERAVQILEQILADAPEPSLQEKAVFALAQHESPRAGEILRSYALDSSRPGEIRKKAIFWLGQREEDGQEGQGEFLRGLYGRLDTPELREQVLFAVAQAERPADVDWLLERATDAGEPIELRKKALFWAGQAGASLDRLEALYGSVDDREMREQIIFAMAQRGGEEAVTRLIAIARAERDPELKKKAIFWLGQSNHPRAAEFLMELVGDVPEGGGDR